MTSSDAMTRATAAWQHASRLGYREGAALHVMRGRPSGLWWIVPAAPVAWLIGREIVKWSVGI